MSRIFKMFGNYTRSKEQSDPNPLLSGKIVVNELGEFYGFCDDFYHDGASDDGQTRYVVGAFIENDQNEQRSVAFYTISNDPERAMYLYVIPNAADSISSMMIMISTPGRLQECVQTTITMEEEPFSDETVDTIRAKFKELDTEGIRNGHGAFIEQVYECLQEKGYEP